MSLTLGSIWSNSKNKKIKTQQVKKNPVVEKNTLIKNPVERYDVKSFWGTPTWYLFHGIAANINNKFFDKNYVTILNFIKKVCSNLPCPYCRQHATAYINKIQPNQVDTREKLEKVLFDFHNNVNARIGKKILREEELIKYKTMDMVRCFQLFQSKFFKSYYGDRTFSYWVRKKFEDYFIKFSREIIKYF